MTEERKPNKNATHKNIGKTIERKAHSQIEQTIKNMEMRGGKWEEIKRKNGGRIETAGAFL